MRTYLRTYIRACAWTSAYLWLHEHISVSVRTWSCAPIPARAHTCSRMRLLARSYRWAKHLCAHTRSHSHTRHADNHNICNWLRRSRTCKTEGIMRGISAITINTRAIRLLNEELLAKTYSHVMAFQPQDTESPVKHVWMRLANNSLWSTRIRWRNLGSLGNVEDVTGGACCISTSRSLMAILSSCMVGSC